MRLVLMLLLLSVISCNQISDTKSDGSQGAGAPVKTAVTRRHDKGDLKVKIKELLVKFGLSDEGKQIVYKIQKIVTNPDIGKDDKAGGYKTYDDLKFYNLLDTLGALKVKEIVGHYLKVDRRQNEVKNAFSQAINNAAEGPLKERLQNKLDDYQDGYALRLKKLFKDDNANAVYAAFTADDYIVPAISEIESHLNELKVMSLVVAEVFKNPEGTRVDGGSGSAVGPGDVDGSAGAEIPASSQFTRVEGTRVDEDVTVTEPAKGTLGIGGSGGDGGAEDTTGALGLVVVKEPDGTEDIEGIYLEFNDEAKRVIDKLRKLVVIPSEYYKTYTVQEFDGLIRALGDSKVKDMVKTYGAYESEYNGIKGLIDRNIPWDYVQEMLSISLSDAEESLKIAIRKFFTKFNDDGTADLAALPDPNYVYQSMRQVDSSIFKGARGDVVSIMNYVNIMVVDLSSQERYPFSYIKDESGMEDSDGGLVFNFVVLLGKLNKEQFKAISTFNSSVIEEKEATLKVINNIRDGIEDKKAVQHQFDSYVRGYHGHLISCAKHKDPKTFYDQIMTGTYAENFKMLRKAALKIIEENKAGSKPGIPR